MYTSVTYYLSVLIAKMHNKTFGVMKQTLRGHNELSFHFLLLLWR